MWDTTFITKPLFRVGFLWDIPAPPARRHPWSFLCQCVLCMKGFTRLPRRSCHRSWNVPDAFCPARIFLWSLSVSCLASSQIWQISGRSYPQSLGVPGAADVFPGMILFTGQDPDPFWAEAIVSEHGPLAFACLH